MTAQPIDPDENVVALPEPTLQDLGLIVAGGKIMSELVDQRVAAARATVLDRLRALNKETGTSQIEVKVPGVTKKVATISISQPSDKPVVADEPTFTAWVEEHYEDEVETIVRVRPAFLKLLLEKMVKLNIDTGECFIVDEETGEPTVIPGLKAVPGGDPTSFSLRFATGGKDIVADLVNGASIPALTSDAPAATVIDVQAEDTEAGAA